MKMINHARMTMINHARITMVNTCPYDDDNCMAVCKCQQLINKASLWRACSQSLLKYQGIPAKNMPV